MRGPVDGRAGGDPSRANPRLPGRGEPADASRRAGLGRPVTPEDYAALCRALAGGPAAACAICGAGCGDRMARSPLCDARGFTAGLEDAFRGDVAERIPGKKFAPWSRPASAPGRGALADGSGRIRTSAT